MSAEDTNKNDYGLVHAALIRGFLQKGCCPSRSELSTALGLSMLEIVEILHGLASIHGLVLHPESPEPWVVHPFSSTPTLNYVELSDKGCWSPCIWCGLGAIHLAGENGTLHTRLGAETETLKIEVKDGNFVGDPELVVHFSVPPRSAWNNVHAHCARVLPFRSEQAISDWCARHHVPQGEVLSLAQVQRLARRWYGPYADPSWKKWTVRQAQEIFTEVGLTSRFWQLEGEGAY